MLKISKQTAEQAQAIIMAIKAEGGYKYRKYIKISDIELAEYTKRAEATIYMLIEKVRILEKIINTPKGIYSVPLPELYKSELKKLEVP